MDGYADDGSGDCSSIELQFLLEAAITEDNAETVITRVAEISERELNE